MQKKCRRCGELFTPVDGEFYCEKCGGTAAVVMPNEKPEITTPEELPPEIKKCTLREAREKADIDKKTISDKLQINVSTYHNYESKEYMPKNLFLQFCEIVSIPPEQIKCREPMKPVRPTNICNVQKPANYDNKSMKSKIKTMENVIKNVKADIKSTGTADKPIDKSDLQENDTKHTHLPVNTNIKGDIKMKKYLVIEYMVDTVNGNVVRTCETYEEAVATAQEYQAMSGGALFGNKVHIREVAAEA